MQFFPYSFLLSSFILLTSCGSNGVGIVKSPDDKLTANEDSVDLTSRALAVRNMTSEQIFLRLPQEVIKLEGFEKMTLKHRKELLQKGSLGDLRAEIKNHYLSVRENFENEDDDNERAAILEMTIFQHSEEDYILVYVLQKYSSEDKLLGDELLSQGFWKYDGKEWTVETAAIPTITTAMFFDKGFNLSKVKEDFITWTPAAINDRTLTASLSYDKYAKFGLKPETLIKNETHIINIIWNGQLFEVQRKPQDLK